MQKSALPPRRYVGDGGIVIDTTNSVVDCNDSPFEHVIKRLCAYAEKQSFGLREWWELVFYIEAETVNIVNGNDEGGLYPGREIFRTPFPFDRTLRKAIIRSVLQTPYWHKEGGFY